MHIEKMTDPIETERLVLFPYTEENLALFNRDLPGFEETYGVVYRGEELDHLLTGYLRKLERELAEDPENAIFFTEFLIVLKENDHVIGSIDYKYIPRDGMTEVGYGMNPAYEGHGYMTEALGAFLEFGKAHGIKKVRADTRPDNIRSQNVLKRCGFRFLHADGNLWWEADLEDKGPTLSDAHRKIIDAVIRKARAVCPESLAMISVCGSAATGDVHPKSDLDLMILINDVRGRALAEGFLLDDAGIGYDLYCTTWEMLEALAECPHAHLAKLFDAKPVYIADPAAGKRIDDLRERALSILCTPKRYEKASAAYERAKSTLADCFLADSLDGIRMAAASTICDALYALMLSRGAVFHRGVKRTFEELRALNLPFDPEEAVLRVILAETPDAIREALVCLMKETEAAIRCPSEREAPTPENLSGTYEEMFSNWHGKMEESAGRGDIYSSFMSLASLEGMIREIGESVSIPEISFMDRFDPEDLTKNLETYNEAIAEYLREYRTIGMEPHRYENADAFVRAYLADIEQSNRHFGTDPASGKENP